MPGDFEVSKQAHRPLNLVNVTHIACSAFTNLHHSVSPEDSESRLISIGSVKQPARDIDSKLSDIKQGESSLSASRPSA